MSTIDRVHEQVQYLPESAQQTVLDFVEQLARSLRQEDYAWAACSLQAALRGMETDV